MSCSYSIFFQIRKKSVTVVQKPIKPKNSTIVDVVQKPMAYENKTLLTVTDKPIEPKKASPIHVPEKIKITDTKNNPFLSNTNLDTKKLYVAFVSTVLTKNSIHDLKSIDF